MTTIGINALFVVPNQVGGTEYHLRSFVNELQKLDRVNQYIIFCNQENYQSFSDLPSNWHRYQCLVKANYRWWRIVYEQLLLPVLLLRKKCRVLHSFGYFGPIWTVNCRQVITVHDANWLDFSSDNPLIHQLVLKWLIELNLRFSDLVITDSAFSQIRLQYHFPWLTNKLKVISPAVNQKFYSIKRKVKSSPRIFLCVSNFYPHKKIPYLIKLWQKFSQLHQGTQSNQLVLIGNSGTDKKRVEKLINQTSNILHLKQVRFVDLLNWYAQASVCLSPSIYEGFGYPVYEAASLNIPTIVGNLNLYQTNLQPKLLELSFELDKDVLLLNQAIKHQPKTSHLVSKDLSAATQEHISIYQTLAAT